MQRDANSFSLPNPYQSHIIQRQQAKSWYYSLIFASNLVNVNKELSKLGMIWSFSLLVVPE